MTLLEIAISLAILAIALVALANLFPVGLRASRRAVDYSSASILAQRVIDNIKRSASIDDGNSADNNCIGYFELTTGGDAGGDYFPFSDDDLSETTWMPTDGVYKYQYDYTDDTVYIKVEDWDANGNTRVGREDPLPTNWDWDDVYLSQKVYVAVYWTEADRDRAETFITYISNPFYEKYK